MTIAAYVVLYAFLNASGLILLRRTLGSSGGKSGPGFSTLVSDPRFFIGLMLYAMGFVTWILTLRRYELTTVYPVFVGVGYVSVVAGSLVFLNESASVSKLVGIAVIGGGLWLVLR